MTHIWTASCHANCENSVEEGLKNANQKPQFNICRNVSDLALNVVFNTFTHSAKKLFHRFIHTVISLSNRVIIKTSVNQGADFNL